MDHAFVRQPDRAVAAANCFLFHIFRSMTKRRTRNENCERVPRTSPTRMDLSLQESTSYDLHEYIQNANSKRETVLYLAYGSNLSKETFRGNRGIKPLSQVNVQVPSLRLTFDLPGIPYKEPCFANTGLRDPEQDLPDRTSIESEKTPLLNDGRRDDEKAHWHKGLVGVVYEVTPEDYAHIIATEGGGASYQDILVDCYPFPTADPSCPVPDKPTLPSFRAHTLFAPALPPGEDPPPDSGRFQRPDPDYAQPSARYLKLITDGAAELALPYEYQDYLNSLQPYTITTNKQRVGQFIFLSLWGPFISLIFAMGRMFQDEQGRQPAWLRELTGALFKALWASYDIFFQPIFGDGERTITDGGKNAAKGFPAMKISNQIEKGAAKLETDLESMAGQIS